MQVATVVLGSPIHGSLWVSVKLTPFLTLPPSSKKSTNMVIKVYVSMITFTQEVSMEEGNFYCVFEAPVWI